MAWHGDSAGHAKAGRKGGRNSNKSGKNRGNFRNNHALASRAGRKGGSVTDADRGTRLFNESLNQEHEISENMGKHAVC